MVKDIIESLLHDNRRTVLFTAIDKDTCKIAHTKFLLRRNSMKQSLCRKMTVFEAFYEMGLLMNTILTRHCPIRTSRAFENHSTVLHSSLWFVSCHQGAARTAMRLSNCVEHFICIILLAAAAFTHEFCRCAKNIYSHHQPLTLTTLNKFQNYMWLMKHAPVA